MKFFIHTFFGTARYLFSALAPLVLLAGCKLFENYTPAALPAGQQVRVMNMAYGAGVVTAKVDTANPTQFTLPYGSSSGYFAKPGGVYSFIAKGKDLPGYNDKAIRVSYGRNTTAFLFTNPGHPMDKTLNQIYYYYDSVLTAPTGRAAVKVFNFSDNYGGGNSQLFVWFGATNLESPGAFRLNPLSFYGLNGPDLPTILSSPSGIRSLAAGDYPITLGYYITQVKAAGLIQVQSRYRPVHLVEGNTYTVVITGTKDPTDQIPLQLIVVNDQDNTTQVLVQDVVTSLLRFVHAAYNVPDYQTALYYGLDFRVDGQLQVDGLRYFTKPDYQKSVLDSSTRGYANVATVGNHTLTAYPNGNFNPSLASVNLNITDGTSYTIFAAPHELNSKAIDLVPIPDTNGAAEGGRLKLRVVNLSPSPELANVDVFLNATTSPFQPPVLSFNGPIAQGLQFQKASNYLSFFLQVTSQAGAIVELHTPNGPLIPGTNLNVGDDITSNPFVDIKRTALNASYTLVITGELNTTDPRKALRYRFYLDKSL